MINKQYDLPPSKGYSALVDHLIRKDGNYHPNLGGITNGGMANHFPMTILSLAELGGSDDDISRFVSSWPRYRTPVNVMNLKDRNILTNQNWPKYLGKASFFKEFRRVFLEALVIDGVDSVVVNALKTMENGLPMGLFHPLIRLSFARMHGDLGVIADALSYFAIRYDDLYLVSDFSGSNSLKTPLKLWQSISLGHSSGEIGIVYEGASLPTCEKLCSNVDVQQWALNSGFNVSIDNLDGAISEISDAAVRLYLYEPALTTLHAVTSAQALADLTYAYLSEENKHLFVGLWQRYWVWLTGLFLEKGAPSKVVNTKMIESMMLPSWEKIGLAGASLNEVHTIKMIFSCKWLAENVDDNARFKYAAIKLLQENGIMFQ